MNLLIDIGNSSVKWRLVNNKKIIINKTKIKLSNTKLRINIEIENLFMINRIFIAKDNIPVNSVI